MRSSFLVARFPQKKCASTPCDVRSRRPSRSSQLHWPARCSSSTSWLWMLRTKGLWISLTLPPTRVAVQYGQVALDRAYLMYSKFKPLKKVRWYSTPIIFYSNSTPTHPISGFKPWSGKALIFYSGVEARVKCTWAPFAIMAWDLL